MGLVAAFVAFQNIFWPAVSSFGDFTIAAWVAAILAVVTLAGSVIMTTRGREGWGFILGGLAIVSLFSGVFLKMFGNLGFADEAGLSVTEQLNVITAASSPTTLTIMTWAAVIFVPIVIGYQAWSYWVFKRRISTKNIPDEVEAVA